MEAPALLETLLITNQITMILITKIETREVPEDYATVASCDLLRDMNSHAYAENQGGEPCRVNRETYTTETIRGRRFTRSQWNEKKQEPEIISDVTIGMTADVQNLLGMQAEAWEDMEIIVEENRSRSKELCMLLENSQVETQRFTGMTRWKRIKWAVFQK